MTINQEKIIRITTEIADLAQWEDIGDLDEAETERLADLRQELHMTELCEKREAVPMSTTRLDEYEAEQQSIHNALGKLGREIATMRGEVTNIWEFHSYERTAADGWAITDYPKGTRLIKINYRIPQRYEPDYVTIMFPESYLDGDWQAEEQARVNEKVEQAAQKRAVEQADREARDREQYDRLHKRFGVGE